MLTLEQFKKSFRTVECNYKNNKEFYNINFSILLLYLTPYLFFSSFIVLSIYKIYNIIKIDFEFDLKINTIDDTIEDTININFNKFENQPLLVNEKKTD